MFACFLKGRIVSGTQSKSPNQAWVKLKKMIRFNYVSKVSNYYVESVNENGSVK